MLKIDIVDTSTAVAGRPGRQLPELRRMRESRLLSQQELADRASVARNTISGIEAGRTGARYATIRKLAAALDCPPSDLFQSQPERKD